MLEPTKLRDPFQGPDGLARGIRETSKQQRRLGVCTAKLPDYAMAATETLTFTLPDGRRLGYGIYGDASAKATTFYFHGFPGSHHEALIISAAAAEQGLRIISPSRPGGGGSDYHEGRSLTDFANDTLSLADHLKLDRFSSKSHPPPREERDTNYAVVIAVSGGAPYGLAAAHSLPHTRMMGLVLVCGIYPISLGLEGMAFSNRAIFWLSPWLPQGLLARLFSSQLPATSPPKDGTDGSSGPDEFERALDATMRSRSGPDVAAWAAPDPTLRRAVTESVRGAMEHGGAAAAQEAKLLSRAWEFALADVKLPAGRVVMFHGTEDVNVGLPMASKAAALIGGGEGVELRVKEGEGHASLGVNCVKEIVGLAKEWA
jgi:hypothetical protein